MIGSVSTKSKKKSVKNSSPIITLSDSPREEYSAEIPADIHVVESSMTKSESGGKKKGKKKKTNLEREMR